MMISSMTGYATIKCEIDAQTAAEDFITDSMVVISVDLSSVNGRFLDLHFYMPEELRFIEPKLRKMFSKKLARGHIEIKIELKNHYKSIANTLNETSLNNLFSLSKQIRTVFQEVVPLSINDILNWPDVFMQNSIDLNGLASSTINICGKALDILIENRKREGAKLNVLLLDFIAQMESIIMRAMPTVPEFLFKKKQKIVSRLQEIINPLSVSDAKSEELENRILQELAIYTVRNDTSEELSRLLIHLMEVKRVLNMGGAVGKRLDFLMQEINRETNTLGSKAMVLELTNISIELKLLIEQMREQIQNLE